MNIFTMLRILPRLGGALSALILLFVFLIISLSIVMRYFFNAPIAWSDELIGYLMVAIGFLGLSSALLDDRHISIDLLTPLLSDKARKLLALVGYLVVAAVGVTFFYSALETLTFNYDFGLYSVGSLDAPIWITQLPMVVGSAFLVLAALTKFLELSFRTPKEKSE